MKHYRYDVLGADFDCHIKAHPQDQMRLLGFNVIKSESFPIGDCWFFRVKHEIHELPDYLRELPDNFKFSDEIQPSAAKKEPPLYKSDGTLTDYGRYELEHGRLSVLAHRDV